MSTNTVSKAQKEVFNEAVRGLVDSSVFTGVTSYGGGGGGPSFSFQGSNFGYTAGGYTGAAASNVIQKFSFTSDGNATDVGDLLGSTYNTSSLANSPTYGYLAGGYDDPLGPVGGLNVIQKFSFSVDGNSTDVGDLSTTRFWQAGQSSGEYGYSSGGRGGSPTADTNTIEKYSMTVDENATDVGDLTVTRRDLTGQSSSSNGYSSGGAGTSNVIDKFPFATDTNATDVGDLTTAKESLAGQSSSTHGYTSGGNAPPLSNVIDKFPFAADANATDVGDLLVSVNFLTGVSSTASGYNAGGTAPAYQNVIQKFPFSSDTNSTDVGDLTSTMARFGGTQN